MDHALLIGTDSRNIKLLANAGFMQRFGVNSVPVLNLSQQIHETFSELDVVDHIVGNELAFSRTNSTFLPWAKGIGDCIAFIPFEQLKRFCFDRWNRYARDKSPKFIRRDIPVVYGIEPNSNYLSRASWSCVNRCNIKRVKVDEGPVYGRRNISLGLHNASLTPIDISLRSADAQKAEAEKYFSQIGKSQIKNGFLAYQARRGGFLVVCEVLPRS